MNQNQNQSPALQEDKKLSKLGFGLNLLEFAKCLYIFGIVLVPIMINSSLAFLLNDINVNAFPVPDRRDRNFLFVPEVILLLFSGLFIAMIVFLKKKCETQDFIGIEKIAVIANYFLRSSEIIVFGIIVGFSVYKRSEEQLVWPHHSFSRPESSNEKVSKSIKFVLDNCMLPTLTFLFMTSMSALNIYAVRTKKNSLLESYIIARYIITGIFFIYTFPYLLLGLNFETYIFLTALTWNGIMIISIGMTLILHGLRTENTNP